MRKGDKQLLKEICNFLKINYGFNILVENLDHKLYEKHETLFIGLLKSTTKRIQTRVSMMPNESPTRS